MFHFQVVCRASIISDFSSTIDFGWLNNSSKVFSTEDRDNIVLFKDSYSMWPEYCPNTSSLAKVNLDVIAIKSCTAAVSQKFSCCL